MEAPTLHGRQVVVRALTEADTEAMAEIRAKPEVERWWGSGGADGFAEKLGDEELAAWVVEVDGVPVGFVEAYEESEPEFRHAGLDLFLDPSAHGRGLGQDVVRTVARHLLDDRGHHRLIIDPAEDNTRAIRTYQTVGFRPVGVMRSYWWDHVEERWANGLLLDLLREELR